MFDIGFSELALIAVLALVIAGPERLPGIMRGLGRFAGRARDVYAAMRSELEKEVDRATSTEDEKRDDANRDDPPGDDK
ncbi:MAG: Sec-independent protein translocase protein TatB [Gammaproteobacteria bacterium]|nr:Sec-independent protein translocase protein TatB [Gammaproteobacteria bacterium]